MKVLVVDDEALARQRLLRLLGRLRPDAQLLEAENGQRALEIARSETPEILLLDIRMPGMDGVAVAAELAMDDSSPAVIFCTAYDEYALDALRHQAVAYLLKPVREQELSDALIAAPRVNRAQLDALGIAAPRRPEVVSAGHRGMQTLPVAQIRCFLAEDKYVRACAPSGEVLLTESLRELEEEFAGRFQRVHRNALVALGHIERLSRIDTAWCVELRGIRERPQVSRRHLSPLKQALAKRGAPVD